MSTKKNLKQHSVKKKVNLVFKNFDLNSSRQLFMGYGNENSRAYHMDDYCSCLNLKDEMMRGICWDF